MEVVATVGAVTALFAGDRRASSSLTSRNVLAYSTISQIGYMMLGVGTGAFAVWHFPSDDPRLLQGPLFLCAGAVIHSLDGEQDMNKMGGLRHHLPITFATMLIATLAIAPFPLSPATSRKI